MKSLILKPHELANIDRLTCIVRPMKEPHGWTTKLIDGEHKKWPAKPVYDKQQKCNITGFVDPPFSPGETVFVKETWGTNGCLNCPIHYKFTEPNWKKESLNPNARWYSAHSMPQWASRYKITFVDVEAKQVCDLSIDQIKSIGVKSYTGFDGCGGHYSTCTYYQAFPNKYGVFVTAKDAMECLWDSMFPKHPYDSNPWLWLCKVEVVKV